jgi:hypothetical protein
MTSLKLLNVQGVSDVRQMEIHTAEPLVPQPSPSEVDIATAKLERYRPSGTIQIPPELIHAGSEKLYSENHNLINSL